MDTRKKRPTVGAVGENDTARVAPLSTHSVPHPTTRVNHLHAPSPEVAYYLNRRATGIVEDDHDRLAQVPGLLPDPTPEDCLDYLKDHSGWMAEALGVEIEGLPPGSGPPLTLLTAYDILTTEWPEPVWAVPDVLPVGLSILAGKPKIGKSWLAMQVALAVGAGGVALGRHAKRGPVLYLALEDPPRRLSERMTQMRWPIDPDLPVEFMAMGRFVDEVGNLRNGGGERLARQIEYRSYRLVVIDTLSRSVGGDQNDATDMTVALTPLQEMAHEHNCAVMLIDHHRKGFGTDPDAVGDILGSVAKGAMVDTAWGLYHESGKAGAKLAIVGRDVIGQTLALTFDHLTGCWQCEGDAGELELTENRRNVIDAIRDLGPSTCTEVTEAVDRNKGSVYRDLQDLVSAVLLVKRGDCYEEVP